jgi:2-iminobutanoate/2-iminopropanoate deaminase
VKELKTELAPSAIGSYSQAIDTGNLVFISGQLPINPETNELVEGDIGVQTEQVMKNIGAILATADLSYKHIAKATVFMKSLGDFSTFNEVYSTFLSEPYPARATFEVSRLPKDAEIEIEIIAIKS